MLHFAEGCKEALSGAIPVSKTSGNVCSEPERNWASILKVLYG